ncbi:MAG: hypothetical protein ACI8X5_000270 [Planctomycetota bacterium]|jgi:uncharacterized protein YcbX
MNQSEAPSQALGRISALWRHPVKSMLGGPCDELALNSRGVVGDRLFAVRTPEGKLGSGKDSTRFQRIEGLFKFSSSYDGDVPIVTFPGARTLRGDDSSMDGRLAQELGLPVSLAREDEVEHLDAGPVHLLTTAALRWLGTGLGEGPADARRFRPNLVIDAEGESQVEREWLGQELRIGEEVRLRISAFTERCCMTGMPQADLGSDARVLKYLAAFSEAQFGVYAEVIQAGTIRVGDTVRH